MQLVAQGCAHRVAVQLRQREPQTQGAQELGGRAAGAQHDGVEPPRPGVARQLHAGRGRVQLAYRGAEHELHAQRLRGLAQHECEQAAVAQFATGQVQGAGQGRLRAQPGLDGARGFGIQFVQHHASVTQQLQHWGQGGVLGFAAQQHQAAATGFRVELQGFQGLVQAAVAVARQLFQRSQGGRQHAFAGLQGVAAPAPEPGQIGARGAAGNAHQGLAAKQWRACRAQGAGRGPGAQQPGGE